MEPRQVFIHAGAHRTGTSSFQMCLHLNAAALGRAGYQAAYPGRDGVPSGTLGLRLPAPRHGTGATGRFAPRVAEALADYDPGRPLILSEENIPGRMIHFQSGHFYPAAEARLAALRAGLGEAVIPRLLIVLRSYDAFYVSCHRKRAEDNWVPPFADSIPNLMAMDRGWPEIVALLRDALRPERLIVLPYENRGDSVDLLRRLVPGLAAVELVEPETAVNLSATDAALEVLQARYRAGETLSRDEWRDVVADHASDTADRGFARFSDEHSAGLRARYAADLARISKMRGVDFGG